MSAAVDWLRSRGVSDIALTHGGPTNGGDFRTGFPTAHLPELDPLDTVYAAGAPDVVEAVKKIAEGAGARCYSDPFTIAPESMSAFDRITRFIDEHRKRFRHQPAVAAAETRSQLQPRCHRVRASRGRWRTNDSGQRERGGIFCTFVRGARRGLPTPSLTAN